MVWNHGILWLSIQLGMSSSQLTNISQYFSEGLKQPTRKVSQVIGIAPTLLVTQMGHFLIQDSCVLKCVLCMFGLKTVLKIMKCSGDFGVEISDFPSLDFTFVNLMKEDNAKTPAWKSNMLICFLSPIPGYRFEKHPSYQWYHRCFWVKWPSDALQNPHLLVQTRFKRRRWSAKPASRVGSSMGQFSMGWDGKFKLWNDYYPLVNIQNLWKITIFNGKTHYFYLFLWSFSIVMLVYQRVNHYRMGPQFGIAKLVNITFW